MIAALNTTSATIAVTRRVESVMGGSTYGESQPSVRTALAISICCSVSRYRSLIDMVRYHLAHHARQGGLRQRVQRHPAHAARRARTRRDVRRIDDKLERKMRESVRDCAG